MIQPLSHCDIEHHAVLFGLMAKRVIEACPETGVDVIRRGVRAYGTERGKRMAERCLAHGDPLTPENYQIYNERSSKPGQMNSVPAEQLPEFVIHVKKCAWVDAWSAHGLLDYGKYYCLDIDRSLTNGFSSGYEVKIGGWLSWGSEYCDMHWGFPMDDACKTRIAEKKASFADHVVKTYDYHPGHMFSTVGVTIVRELGDDGVAAVKLALADFIAAFGREYVLAFAAAYAPLPAIERIIGELLADRP